MERPPIEEWDEYRLCFSGQLDVRKIDQLFLWIEYLESQLSNESIGTTDHSLAEVQESEAAIAISIADSYSKYFEENNIDPPRCSEA